MRVFLLVRWCQRGYRDNCSPPYPKVYVLNICVIRLLCWLVTLRLHSPNRVLIRKIECGTGNIYLPYRVWSQCCFEDYWDAAALLRLCCEGECSAQTRQTCTRILTHNIACHDFRDGAVGNTYARYSSTASTKASRSLCESFSSYLHCRRHIVVRDPCRSIPILTKS